MPPIIKRDENLFEESTMSFGEHLDELRVTLFRAVIWLVAGVAMGLFCGTWVMKAVQFPLQNALDRYYLAHKQHELEARVAELREAGYPETLCQLPSTHRLLPEEVLMLPEDLHKIVVIGGGGTYENRSHNQQNKQGISVYQVDNHNDLKLSSSSSGASEPVRFFLLKRIEDDPRTKASTLSTQEGFSMWLKASFLAGFIFASPGIFWSFWSFIAAGLYGHEKKYVKVFLPISLALFFAGVLLAFFVVFRFVLDFLFMFNQMLDINPTPRISEWMSFALLLPVGFGVSFQLPLVMFFLERVGIVSIQTYLSNWRISVLVIFFISMILTPADPWSMLLMAMPLTLLYFGGVGMCKLFPRKKGLYEED